MCTPLHGPVQFAIIRGSRLVGHMFPLKLPFPGFPFQGSSPHVTLFLGPSPLIIPNGISIGSAVFALVQNAMMYNALSVEKKTPKIAHSPWDFVILPEEDRATDIGDISTKIW